MILEHVIPPAKPRAERAAKRGLPQPPVPIPVAGYEDIDLAHADHPPDSGRGPAAVHVTPEGNATPLRVRGLRTGLLVPDSLEVSV